jgi:hypothetical protein
MSGTRPSLFENESETDIDLGQFAPRAKPDRPPLPAEEMRRLSEASGFPSRAPSTDSSQPTVVSHPTVNNLPMAARRGVKTGRTVLLNARVRQQAHDRFHAIVAAGQARFEAGEISHRPTLGEIVERALAALEREIAKGGYSK